MFYDAIDTLKTIITIPSFSGDEANAAAYLQQTWHKAGMKVNRSGNNLWICSEKMDSVKPTILLNSHIDTVKPVSGWKHDPFLPTEDEDGSKLYGLGSNDAGASLVSLFAAFRLLSSRPQPYNLVFLASAEEEISGKNGIESIIPIMPRCALAVVGEPTEMRPAIAEKGLLVVDCTATGVAGHAAREEGINAIEIAIKDISCINDYIFPNKSALLGSVRKTVTCIQAGTQHNVIPDKCTFTIDIRTNEMYTNEEALSIIRSMITSEARPRSLRLRSSSIDPSHPFVRRCETLGLEPFGSPTLSDQALIPFPSVKIGPGKSSRSHTADEYILTDEIRHGISAYIRLLDGLKV